MLTTEEQIVQDYIEAKVEASSSRQFRSRIPLYVGNSSHEFQASHDGIIKDRQPSHDGGSSVSKEPTYEEEKWLIQLINRRMMVEIAREGGKGKLKMLIPLIKPKSLNVSNVVFRLHT